MNDFTASNGIGVEINDEEQIVFAVGNRPITPIWTNSSELKALREFFRAEEDERLGRWRYPGDPDFVVYGLDGEQAVRVIRESTAVSFDYLRDEHRSSIPNAFAAAAYAYFDAHPERKPWHDAKPGETWRLTVNDRIPLEIDLTFNVIGVEGVIPSRFARPQVGGEQMEYPLDSPAITAGRRIWPEVSS